MEQLRIITGGQTGIDRMALDVAQHLGLPTGGTAAKDFMTELGPDPGLKAFGLVECPEPGYPARTRQNILDADATVIYGSTNSKGSSLTIQLCRALSKRFLVNPEPDALVAFLQNRSVEILNVAGNRQSRMSRAQLAAYRDRFSRSLEQWLLQQSKGMGQGLKSRR